MVCDVRGASTASPGAGSRRRLLLSLALAALLLAAPTAAIAEGMPARPEPVRVAMELLATTPATTELVTALDQYGVAVEFSPTPAGIFARYNVRRRTVEIDPQWAEVETPTLAAVLAHEAVHIQDAVSGALASGGAQACIESELRAFRVTGLLWLALYGEAGKLVPLNDLERQLNYVGARQAQDPDGLEQLVRRAYTDQCAT